MESELVIWESGEAELGIVTTDGMVEEQHYDGLDIETLVPVLQRLLSIVS